MTQSAELLQQLRLQSHTILLVFTGLAKTQINCALLSSFTFSSAKTADLSHSEDGALVSYKLLSPLLLPKRLCISREHTENGLTRQNKSPLKIPPLHFPPAKPCHTIDISSLALEHKQYTTLKCNKIHILSNFSNFNKFIHIYPRNLSYFSFMTLFHKIINSIPYR